MANWHRRGPASSKRNSAEKLGRRGLDAGKDAMFSGPASVPRRGPNSPQAAVGQTRPDLVKVLRNRCKFGRSRSKSGAKIDPKLVNCQAYSFARHHTEPGPSLAKVGRSRPKSTEFGLVRSRSVKFGRDRSKLAQFGAHLVDLGPKVGPCFVELGPNPADPGPKMVDVDPCFVNVGT